MQLAMPWVTPQVFTSPEVIPFLYEAALKFDGNDSGAIVGRKFQLEIIETAQQLSNQLKHCRSASDKERLQMLYWFKTGQVLSRAEMARCLQRDPATIGRWGRKYRQGGLRGLLQVKKAPGKAPALTAESLKRLQTRLQDPSGFSSYSQIQQWLATECGQDLKYKTVYKWVHDRLQARLKVPRPRSLKQHPRNRSLPPIRSLGMEVNRLNINLKDS